MEGPSATLRVFGLVRRIGKDWHNGVEKGLTIRDSGYEHGVGGLRPRL